MYSIFEPNGPVQVVVYANPNDAKLALWLSTALICAVFAWRASKEPAGPRIFAAIGAAYLIGISVSFVLWGEPGP